MPNIQVDAYKSLNNKTPFQIKHLWAVKEPCIEFGSKSHGDLALTFKDDGSVEIMYWSSRVSIDAKDVIPTHLVLKP